jgi:hypothetical protein
MKGNEDDPLPSTITSPKILLSPPDQKILASIKGYSRHLSKRRLSNAAE